MIHLDSYKTYNDKCLFNWHNHIYLSYGIRRMIIDKEKENL